MKLDERLVDMLMLAEELREQGRPVAPEALCRDCPELLPDLRRLLSGMAAVDQLLHAPAPDATPSLPPGSCERAAPAGGPPPGYEIEGELGRGGMGVVYKARHRALKRTVALKMILAADHADEADRRRFRVEAEAAARLSHANIVRVYEVGESGGLPFLALEFVEGGSLAQRLQGGPLPPAEAARLVEALARAMQLAHSRNVVHRDLKPANVLLSFSGGSQDRPAAYGRSCEPPLNECVPKITDFGLARRLDEESGQTQTGAIVGTPSYMAPEQASGRRDAAGPAADVWALGAILYECLTGRLPFDGAGALETLRRVRSAEPAPPRALRPVVPRDLETVCLKCLQKEPEQRYGSAAGLADDLGRFLRGEPVAARPVGPAGRLARWARRNPAVAALLSAAVALSAAVLGLAVARQVWTQEARLAAIRREAEARQADAQREEEAARRRREEVRRRLAESRADALTHAPDDEDEDTQREAEVMQREALWKLSGDDDDVKRLFFRALLERPAGAERLARHAGWAVRAGVGFDAGRRDAVAALLRERLAEGNDPRMRRACAEVAAVLRAPDPELARLACRPLLDELRGVESTAPGPHRWREKWKAEQDWQTAAAHDAALVAVLAAALGRDEASEVCAAAIESLPARWTDPPDDLLRAVADLSGRLLPDAAGRLGPRAAPRQDRREAGKPPAPAAGAELTPDQADAKARALMRTLAPKDATEVSPGRAITIPPVGDAMTAPVARRARAASLANALAGLAGRLTPERTTEAMGVLRDRINWTLAHPPVPRGAMDSKPPTEEEQHKVWRREWNGLVGDYEQALGVLARRADEQALVDLMKRPDCGERCAGVLRAALGERLGMNFADPWKMADWLRAHRPDLDLDTPPRRPAKQDQP